ncbi:IMP cyclohydrolase [Streptomyces sp. DH8]|uniref:IMP cyclohydrolase n=1 Tax=Streptomyces sp. DH8 TaxID=2857008 RepID=UPI001E49D0D4|nr:IMP cyclohydrolase [Streptomyces sp. DH8]
MNTLTTLLSENVYPGRGVLCARTLSGDVLGGYFLTGRSPASRDRALVPQDGRLIVAPTKATSKDALRHYTAAESAGDWLVFGNGEQVTTVAERLRGEDSATVSLSDLEFEPDPPILTSRITALLSKKDGGRTAVLGAARASRGRRTTSNVMTLTVRDLEPGEGVLLTTYQSDGARVETASPYEEISVEARTGPELLAEIWDALSLDYRIAAAVLDPRQEAADALLCS